MSPGYPVVPHSLENKLKLPTKSHSFQGPCSLLGPPCSLAAPIMHGSAQGDCSVEPSLGPALNSPVHPLVFLWPPISPGSTPTVSVPLLTVQEVEFGSWVWLRPWSASLVVPTAGPWPESLGEVIDVHRPKTWEPSTHPAFHLDVGRPP